MDLSVIIPCFNSGTYLTEAIASIETYEGRYKIEVIIIDDGSTEHRTLGLLNQYRKKLTVLEQANKGPGAARNAGCKIAKGKYLLFLDSDNKLSNNYIHKTLDYLYDNLDIDVLYTNVIFFDSNESRFKPDVFDIEKILDKNYIDTCAVVKKDFFEKIGGFDENKVLIGREDWELWIRCYSNGARFHFLNEPLYYYRIRKRSLSTYNSIEQRDFQSYSYIVNKNIYLFRKCYKETLQKSLEYSYDKNRPLRSLIKYLWYKLI